MVASETRTFSELINAREVVGLTNTNISLPVTNFGTDGAITSPMFYNVGAQYWFGESMCVNFSTGDVGYIPYHYETTSGQRLMKIAYK